jgi:glycosyltransferase involved in cell wall biosynthesis
MNDMNKPLVSVIVPTYNCGPFVAEALDSILSQDWQPLEVIAVDDGSTDNTLAVLRRYGDRIRVLQQPNGGPAAARNLAVRESRGEYLAFLDADDLWLPGHLRVLMSYLQAHPQTRVAYGEWLVWRAGPDGSYPPLAVPRLADAPEVDPANSGWVYPALLVDSIIHIIAAVIHRSVYDAVGGFDASLRTGSDWDFWIRVGRSFPVVKLRRPVAAYRQNPSSVTHVVRKENNGFRLLKRIVDTYGLRDDAGRTAARWRDACPSWRSTMPTVTTGTATLTSRPSGLEWLGGTILGGSRQPPTSSPLRRNAWGWSPPERDSLGCPIHEDSLSPPHRIERRTSGPHRGAHCRAARPRP